jgi:hypothetical protein
MIIDTEERTDALDVAGIAQKKECFALDDRLIFDSLKMVRRFLLLLPPFLSVIRPIQQPNALPKRMQSTCCFFSVDFSSPMCALLISLLNPCQLLRPFTCLLDSTGTLKQSPHIIL